MLQSLSALSHPSSEDEVEESPPQLSLLWPAACKQAEDLQLCMCPVYSGHIVFNMPRQSDCTWLACSQQMREKIYPAVLSLHVRPLHRRATRDTNNNATPPRSLNPPLHPSPQDVSRSRQRTLSCFVKQVLYVSSSGPMILLPCTQEILRRCKPTEQTPEAYAKSCLAQRRRLCLDQ